jgi:hypothetical protein
MTDIAIDIIWIDPNVLLSAACYELPPQGF